MRVLQKIMASLAAAAMLLSMGSVLPAGAEEEGTYGVLTYVNYGDYIEITGCEYTAEEVDIPGEIEGIPVTSIGTRAFYYHESLTSVTIPDGVINIGDSAFDMCYNLTSVTIPDSVKNIGDSAFYECYNLTSVTIPEGVKNISDSAFYECFNLTSITIPEGVTSIGRRAFSSCENLTSVIIPDSVTTIGQDAFYGCYGLTSVEIPDSVTCIGAGAFYWCMNLESVTIPDSVTEMGFSAFEKTPWLDQQLEDTAFLVINDMVIVANPDLCSGDIAIPDGIVKICGEAFYMCKDVTSVTIPDSVVSIGLRAFEGTAWLDQQLEDMPFLIINHMLVASNSELCIDDVAIPDGITEICDGALMASFRMTSVTIPDGVTRIGDYAFNWCENLTSVTIPDSVASIGEGAFSYCFDLPAVTIPDSVTSIGYGAFEECVGLTSVTIENPECRIEMDETTINNSYSLNDALYVEYYYNGTIYGYENSTAQAYAEKYGYDFKMIDEAPETTAPTSGSDEPVYGDADCSGKVDLIDVVALNKHLMIGTELPEQGKVNADVDLDGKLLPVDALNILKYVVKLTELPV